MSGRLCLLLGLPVIVAVFLVSIPGVSPAPATTSTCRCVPDQWEGLLLTTDHEFDLRGGRSATMDTNMVVHYDFRNKKFAMVDVKTGNKAIADYGSGRKYIVRKGMCRATGAPPAMREMCLPDNAVSLGQFRMDADMPVQMWRFEVPYNLSMETVVANPSCIPITEKIYVRKSDYATLTTSMYLDVTLGIANPAIFQAPANCLMDRRAGLESNTVEKRSRGMEHESSSFLDWMRDEFSGL